MVGLKEPSLAVILATYNGEGVLPRVLDGFVRCSTAPGFNWRLIVVDNGSTDATAATLDRFSQRLPLTIVGESRPGKNRALNTALSSLQQTFAAYVFTDDDAIPNPDFLVAWREVIERNPDYELFGGLVEPMFSEPLRPWLEKLRRHFPEIYAENMRPSAAIPARAIFGPNMAVRATVIESGYRFNEKIGPSSADKSYPMGSETEFCTRVEGARGSLAWFSDQPRVKHIVRPDQMTRTFVRGRAYRHGRGVALQQGLASGAAEPLSLGFRAKRAAFAAAGRLGLADAWWEHHWLSGFADGRNALIAFDTSPAPG